MPQNPTGVDLTPGARKVFLQERVKRGIFCLPCTILCVFQKHNEYCTAFHSSFAQVRRHLHKLYNKILLCPPYICTSCITNERCTHAVPPLTCTSTTSSTQVVTNEYCAEFHSWSAQVWRHLHKLHNKGILYCFSPLICTSCIENKYCTEFHLSFAQVA